MVPNFMGIAPLLVPAGQVVTLAQDIEYKNISVFFFPPINRPFPFMSLLVFPDYFADHMGDYEDVLASLETLNLSILKAMDYTKRVYESGSNVDQFVTRFLLKETANQTQSLLSSVESAVDAIDEQTNPARSAAPPALLSRNALGFINPHCFLLPILEGNCWPVANLVQNVEKVRAPGKQ
uniref:Uncharacterized protein n=1 Tax=Buteo japonicus TaxID=224669 RepID=A0A8B9Z1U0_9AVES